MIENDNNYSTINGSEYEENREESIGETIDCAMNENQVVAVKKNMNIQSKT